MMARIAVKNPSRLRQPCAQRDFETQLVQGEGEAVMNEAAMKKAFARIGQGIGEFILLILLSLIAPLLIYIDAIDFSHGVTEASFTEFSQELLLLFSSCLLGYGAWRYPGSRGLFVLAAGFFGTMLIRELDKMFDLLWHGFWLVPAITLSTASILYVAIYCRSSLLKGAAYFANSKSYCFIAFGLVVVLAFSRVFGSGGFFWKDILGEAFSYDFKGSLQEGLELFGYVYVAYGSFLLLRLGKKWHRMPDTHFRPIAE